MLIYSYSLPIRQENIEFVIGCLECNEITNVTLKSLTDRANPYYEDGKKTYTTVRIKLRLVSRQIGNEEDCGEDGAVRE
jgi:hypothetical protein